MSIYLTGKQPAILSNLPKSPREYTVEQREVVIQQIATLSTPSIRKRQQIIAAQMRYPAAQRNSDILADLQEMYDIETAAVILREFQA